MLMLLNSDDSTVFFCFLQLGCQVEMWKYNLTVVEYCMLYPFSIIVVLGAEWEERK